MARVKNCLDFEALVVSTLVTSMTASAPATASTSPAPVDTSWPEDRDSATTSCPRSRAVSRMWRPTVPVAPAIAILIEAVSQERLIGAME